MKHLKVKLQEKNGCRVYQRRGDIGRGEVEREESSIQSVEREGKSAEGISERLLH